MNEVALCRCGSLLIYTYYFQQLQWLCMHCGKLWHKPPRAQASTPEAEAKWRALEAEFMTNCGSKLIVVGMYREGCDPCMPPGEQEHIYHATDADWRECNDAIKWLSERTGREFRLVNGVMTPQ